MATFRNSMETTEGQMQSRRKTESSKQIPSPNLVKSNYSPKENPSVIIDQEQKRKTSQKTSKFSLSKIGRAHTFNIRKKTKDKESEMGGSTRPMKSHEKVAICQDSSYQGRSKSSERSSYHENIISPTSKTGRYRSTSSSQTYDVTNTKETRLSWMTEERSTRIKSSRGEERKSGSRKKDHKRKERSGNREGYYPIPLENPPKILIQDFSSEYTDEMSFDDEYFELVDWAFRVLKLQCCFYAQPQFEEDNVKTHQEEDTLQVITNETARVGSTLDYILHPITTGAANVLQTGAKLADFTTRVWRGIHFDSFVPRRGNQTSNADKR